MTDCRRTMDTDKPCEVAVYSFDLILNGERYGGHIPALSADDAAKMVSAFGGKLIGRLELIIPEDRLCSICAGDVTIDMTHPKPNDEDFPDHIDG